MAITNPLRAAVSNLMFWVPKNDVRNEKIIQEVGLEQERSSVDHCCVDSRPPGALHGRCVVEDPCTSLDAVQRACSMQSCVSHLAHFCQGLARACRWLSRLDVCGLRSCGYGIWCLLRASSVKLHACTS